MIVISNYILPLRLGSPFGMGLAWTAGMMIHSCAQDVSAISEEWSLDTTDPFLAKAENENELAR